MVTFQTTAVSRFTEYFPADLARASRFTVSSNPVEVFIPSTARPPVPVVLDVVPTIARTTDPADPSLRRRQGGWLRVYVARPWYVTGQGEELGVVVTEHQPALPEEPMYDLTTLLDTDRAHHGVPATGMLTAFVEGSNGGRTNVQLPQFLERFPGETMPDINVFTFDPHFDEAGQRWFFDIRVNVPDSYLPMLRLAVVRYQKNAITGESPQSVDHYQLSPVVLVEPVPLLPDRELRIDRSDPATIVLTLSGPTYSHVGDVITNEPDARPEALASVTVLCHARGGPLLTAADD